MRVTGKVEFLDDEELKKKIAEERQMAGQPIEHLCEIFRIHTGEAHFWNMADVLKEPELEIIKF